MRSQSDIAKINAALKATDKDQFFCWPSSNIYYHHYTQNTNDDLVFVSKPSRLIDTETYNRLFKLIQKNVAEYYIASKITWSKSNKLKELKNPDMRYLLIYTNPTGSANDTDEISSSPPTHTVASIFTPDNLVGFAAFDFSFEETMEPNSSDDKEVPIIFCYEIQLEPSLRGKGLGKLLMNTMFQIGAEWDMQSVFLNTFNDNNLANNFYHKLGFRPDPISPCQYLGGAYKHKYKYKILSKRISLYLDELLDQSQSHVRDSLPPLPSSYSGETKPENRMDKQDGCELLDRLLKARDNNINSIINHQAPSLAVTTTNTAIAGGSGLGPSGLDSSITNIDLSYPPQQH
ncbi:hypothetical protein H4219_004951 [Mycoemilia scoparia]|uniref:N-alpha-acetyltransferase 40 n=1 Tax=Mycoemilia scoparia TaxID=417184 RepID=A0A9W8DQH8_9FUNG|nr:hypothetical protein H4219_004951 [Mycoemilia scoparia]